ncbi:MAG: SGNH/GDSL hydrolase family protein [Pseudomonadota bacterium]
MKRRSTIAGVFLTTLVGIGAVVYLAQFAPVGSSSIEAADHIALSPHGEWPLKIQAGSLVAFWGDSNTAGSRLKLRNASFPTQFDQALAPTVTVSTQARGGATASDALGWDDATQAPQVVILMFGSNDADTRGILTPRSPIPVGEFKRDLAGLVDRHTQAGATVVILAPPPVGSSAMQARLEPYRAAARDIAVERGVRFRDTGEAFDPGDTPLQSDKLHINEVGQARLANWLLSLVAVEE